MRELLVLAATFGLTAGEAFADDPKWVGCTNRFGEAIVSILEAQDKATQEMIRLSKTEQFRENAEDFADLFGALGSASIVAEDELIGLSIDFCLGQQ